MQIVKVKGEDGKEFHFPDNMTPEQILSVMRNQYQTPNYGDVLRDNSYAAPYVPSLAERLGNSISSTLYDTGLVSDRYGSQRIGSNVSSMLGALPVIGDAMGGDELGRALKRGDAGGVGMSVLAAVPVIGDASKAILKKSDDVTDLSIFKSEKDYKDTQDAMELSFQAETEMLNNYSPETIQSWREQLDEYKRELDYLNMEIDKGSAPDYMNDYKRDFETKIKELTGKIFRMEKLKPI